LQIQDHHFFAPIPSDFGTSKHTKPRRA
jgi:hypothetical protein